MLHLLPSLLSLCFEEKCQNNLMSQQRVKNNLSASFFSPSPSLCQATCLCVIISVKFVSWKRVLVWEIGPPWNSICDSSCCMTLPPVPPPTGLAPPYPPTVKPCSPLADGLTHIVMPHAPLQEFTAWSNKIYVRGLRLLTFGCFPLQFRS